jgi:hypothetical protein
MSNLTAAFHTYQQATAEHEAKYPFDLMTFLDTPETPKQSAEARAGELLQGGILSAMRHMLLAAAERPLTPFEQEVASLLAVASAEAQ